MFKTGSMEMGLLLRSKRGRCHDLNVGPSSSSRKTIPQKRSSLKQRIKTQRRLKITSGFCIRLYAFRQYFAHESTICDTSAGD